MHHPGPEASGFTLVEVLVALVVLSVGVLALGASAGAAARLIGQGHRSTQAAQLALARIEALRAAAPGCLGLVNGTASHPGHLTEWWTVSGSGRGRSVMVAVRYPTGRHWHEDTLHSMVLCR